MSKRIPEATLPADFKNGQVLYGEDVNKIITILREGVNYNAEDFESIVKGSESAYMAYSLGQLNDFLLYGEVANGAMGLVLRDPVLGGVDLYIYSAQVNQWVFELTLSLLNLYTHQYTGFTKITVSETQPINFNEGDVWLDISED